MDANSRSNQPSSSTHYPSQDNYDINSGYQQQFIQHPSSSAHYPFQTDYYPQQQLIDPSSSTHYPPRGYYYSGYQQQFNNSYSLPYAVMEGHHNVSNHSRAILRDNVKNKKMFTACETGDLVTVKECLDQGTDPNWRNMDDSTPLMFACQNGHHEVVNILINNGADINAKAIMDSTPLMFACQNGHHEVVNILINNGANINAKNKDDSTPLMFACQNGHHEVVNILINNGADINAKAIDDSTPLMFACKNGHHEVVNILINNGANINAKNKDHWTLLMIACQNGHHEVVNILINNGADINAKAINDWTPLIIACYNGHHEVVNILINNGADINAKNKYGRTATTILEWNPKKLPSNKVKKCLDLLMKPTQLKDDKSNVDGSGSKPTSDDSITEREKPKQQKQSSVITSIAERDPYFLKAISEGSGTLKPAVVVMHGPPGAGKTSVKQLLLGRPPLSPQEQNSTGVFERPIRTCRVKAHGGIDKLREVDREEFLQLLANNVNSRTSELKTMSATKEPLQRPHAKHQSTNTTSRTPSVSERYSSPDLPFVNPPSTMYVHLKERTLEPRPPPPPSPRPAIKLNRIMKDIHTRLSGSGSSRSDLFDLDWIYLVDSGGQPQFADILPVLFQSEEALYIVVIRLDQTLDERHHSRYCVNGVTYELPETLELTNRQLILRACQIAEAQSTESSQKCVMIVGTHLDRVSNPDTCVDKLDEELLKIQKEYSNVVVPRNVSRGKVVFSINAMSTGPERVKYTNELQQCLIKVVKRSIKPIEVPIRWFVYELDLEEESKSSHGIVKKDKCVTLGRASGLGAKEIEQSLKFFNKIAVHLYHPDIDDMVLIKMDPLTDRVSALIKTSFIPPQFNPIKDSQRLKQRGLMKKSYLGVVFEDLKDNNCISNDTFLKITQYLNVVVPVGLNEYFIPSALSVNTDHSITDSRYTPCVFSWDDRIIPPGFFFTLIVILLQFVDEHSANYFFLSTQIIQSRDRISLTSKAYGGVVTFFNQHKYVWIHYAGGRGLKDYIDVLKLVVEAMPTAIKKFTKNCGTIKFPSISFFCPFCDGKNTFHPCLLNKDCDFCFCPLDQSGKMEPLTEEMKNILHLLHDHVKKASSAISSSNQRTSYSDQASSSMEIQSSMDSITSTSSTSTTSSPVLSVTESTSTLVTKRSAQHDTATPYTKRPALEVDHNTQLNTQSNTADSSGVKGVHCISTSSSEEKRKKERKRSSSDRTTIPRSHAAILKEYTSELMTAIGDPCMLANGMWSSGLIPDEFVDEATNPVLNRTEKLNKLLLNFYNSLRVKSIKTKPLMIKFCDVLKNQRTDALDSIISKMENELDCI